MLDKLLFVQSSINGDDVLCIWSNDHDTLSNYLETVSYDFTLWEDSNGVRGRLPSEDNIGVIEEENLEHALNTFSMLDFQIVYIKTGYTFDEEAAEKEFFNKCKKYLEDNSISMIVSE